MKPLPGWVKKLPEWLCALCALRTKIPFINQLTIAMAKPFTDELIEALDFGFDLIDHTRKSLADDGRISRMEMVGYLGPLRKAPAAIQGLGNPLQRFRDLPQEERQRIFEFARERFDLPDDQLEHLIEDTLREVYGDVIIASRWGMYIKSRKAA